MFLDCDLWLVIVFTMCCEQWWTCKSVPCGLQVKQTGFPRSASYRANHRPPLCALPRKPPPAALCLTAQTTARRSVSYRANHRPPLCVLPRKPPPAALCLTAQTTARRSVSYRANHRPPLCVLPRKPPPAALCLTAQTTARRSVSYRANHRPPLCVLPRKPPPAALCLTAQTTAHWWRNEPALEAGTEAFCHSSAGTASIVVKWLHWHWFSIKLDVHLF